MQCILRDWNRIWYLSFSHEANFSPGSAVADFRIALAIVSHLITDRANLSAMHGLLASAYPHRDRQVSMQTGPLLLDLERSLSQRDCVLLRGADARTGGGGGRSAPEEAEMETWDFAPAEEQAEAATASEAATPAPRFSGGSEAPVTLRFGHGSEPHTGFAFAHGSEGGPAFSFAGAAESGPGLDHSSSVIPFQAKE